MKKKKNLKKAKLRNPVQFNLTSLGVVVSTLAIAGLAFVYTSQAARIRPIVFSVGDPQVATEVAGIYSINPDGTNLNRVPLAPQPEQSGPLKSPASDNLVFKSYQSSASYMDLYLSNLAGGTGIRLSDTTTNYRTPCFAPSGRKLGFIGQVGQSTGEMALMSVDMISYQTKQLTPNLGNYSGCQWAPGGQKIYYLAQFGDTPRALYSIKADGTGNIKLTEADSFSLSGDGKVIAYSSNTTIYVMSSSGQNVRQIFAEGQVASMGANRSLDYTGSRLLAHRTVIKRNDAGEEFAFRSTLVINTTDGGGQLLTAENVYQQANAMWTPDYRRIIFSEIIVPAGGICTDFRCFPPPGKIGLYSADGLGFDRKTIVEYPYYFDEYTRTRYQQTLNWDM